MNDIVADIKANMIKHVVMPDTFSGDRLFGEWS